MATKKVSDPKKSEQRSLAEALYKDFENLPGEFRVLFNQHSATPSKLGNVAVGIDDVLGEVRASLSGDEIRQAATLVRSHIAHAAHALFELQSFAGTLDGLAWAVDAKHRADTFFHR